MVADFGTAITIDCVNDEGVFQGGAILPGLDMAAKSLQAGTAQLPLVELSNPDWVFGKDTRQAIVGGLVYGARGALRELVETYATELGHWPVVILTGGDAALVCGDVNDSRLGPGDRAGPGPARRGGGLLQVAAEIDAPHHGHIADPARPRRHCRHRPGRRRLRKTCSPRSSARCARTTCAVMTSCDWAT